MSGVDVATIRARYKRACDELDRMTTAPGGPGASWRWSIPANPECDSDLLLSDSLADVGNLLNLLERAQAASEGVDMLIAQAERRGAVKALTETRNAWQRGQWADAPRCADRVQERIANAQHVTDWLTARLSATGGNGDAL